MSRPEPILRLSPRCAREVRRWASGDYPLEACGLLLGQRRPAGLEVLEAVHMRNAQASSERFALDPVEQMEVERGAERRGLAVVGVWHSHPDHPAEPSRRDRVGAWEGYAYLIQATHGGEAGEQRAWLPTEESFRELTVFLEEPS